MRRAVVAAVLALPLLLPAGAAAKGGPATVRLCGASGCAKVAEEPQLVVALGGIGPEVRPATVPPAQPFYRVELTDEFDQSWSGFLVPRAHAVLIGGKWVPLPPPTSPAACGGRRPRRRRAAGFRSSSRARGRARGPAPATTSSTCRRATSSSATASGCGRRRPWPAASRATPASPRTARAPGARLRSASPPRS